MTGKRQSPRSSLRQKERWKELQDSQPNLCLWQDYETNPPPMHFQTQEGQEDNRAQQLWEQSVFGLRDSSSLPLS